MNNMYAVVVVYDPYDVYDQTYIEVVGLTDDQLKRCVKVYVYGDMFSALNRYAETPCLASTIIEGDTTDPADPSDIDDAREEGYDWLCAWMRGEPVEPLWGCE